MRSRSPKTAALYRKHQEERRIFVVEHPYCMVCGGTATDCHEICRGSHRLTAFRDRRTWLSVCSLCNCGPLTDNAKWPLARQAALKLIHNPKDFNRQALNQVRGRADTALSADEVLSEVRNLLMERL